METRPTVSHCLTASGGPRRVAMVLFPDAQVLDVTGPCEVLAGAGRALDAPAYAIHLVAATAGPVRTSGGLALLAERDFGSVSVAERAGYDTLLVAGGLGVGPACRDPHLLDFVREVAGTARRVASVCTGAFVLAEAGLLHGRRATTHWAACRNLAERYPQIHVETDPIYVRDGRFLSSAGVTAGMDLALALVEEDLGRDVALAVARDKVMYLIRPGGQSQYSAQLAAQSAAGDPWRRLGRWICEHPAEALTVPELAARVHMSERNFARRFTAAMGQTPARFVEAARIDAARRALEESDKHVDTIARDCGFGAAERMRRAFHRHLGISPQDYRARFAGSRRPAAGPPPAPSRAASA